MVEFLILWKLNIGWKKELTSKINTPIIKTIVKSYKHWILFILSVVQSAYLYRQISDFRWIGSDDLLTLTLINQESFKEFITSLKSGLNVFPPFYFFSAYLLVQTFEFSKEILLWIHIPLLWISILLTYKLFRCFTNWQIACFSTFSIATIKSAFLTQSIYVRPYCLYYCASLATALTAINFQKKQSKLNFLLYWTAFQVLTHTHYYGLPIGMLVSIPLIFCQLSNGIKLMALVITLAPTFLTYVYFLPDQLGFLFFVGTTGSTTLQDIISYYRALSFPAIFCFVVFLIFSLFNKEKVYAKNNVPIGLLLLGASPLIIIASLSVTVGEGTYLRYFIPAQIGIVAFAIWFISLIRPLTLSRKSTTPLILISFILMIAWSIRNFSNKRPSIERNYPGSMDFDHSTLKDSKIPFFTSHLPTFLKIIHDPDWPLKSNLLRTNEADFIELSKFSKILAPKSKEDLESLDKFIYHFYYSGPHSIIDFDPILWANVNNYTIFEMNHYPLVLQFTRNKDTF